MTTDIHAEGQFRECQGTIDLRRPIGSEKVRGFQPPWYTVFRYRCAECGVESRVRASSFRGRNPEPSVGAIRCGAYFLMSSRPCTKATVSAR